MKLYFLKPTEWEWVFKDFVKIEVKDNSVIYSVSDKSGNNETIIRKLNIASGENYISCGRMLMP